MHGKYCHKFFEVIGEPLLSLPAAFATPLKTNTVISLANSYVNGRFYTTDGLSVSVQNLSKLTDKQMHKVKRIAYPKLKLFHFQIETYYLSDTNYPTDKQSQTDNPSLA